MEYQSGTVDRVFYVRFDHDDDLLEGLMKLVQKEKIRCGWFQIFGGMRNADVVTGPKEPTVPPEPVWQQVDDTREIIGTGSIFFDGKEPKIHLHAAMGHHGDTLTGCVRKNTRVYLLIEAVLFEVAGMTITRPWFEEGQFNRPAIENANTL
ncbi:MAG: DUF296 domain-containing protein [Desulfobulbaceae bacterium]|nr:DUF296 domain-containing protein [Desulfobulbaceae bacterium]